jgi:hypothetical protein
MKKQNKPDTIKTPVGTVEWAHLITPDTKYKEEGQYKLDLIMSSADAQPVIDAIAEKYDAFYAAQLEETGKSKLKRYDLPWEENDGDVKFRFRRKAVIQTKKGPWDRKPSVTDKNGQEITQRISNGSKARVAFELHFWNTPTLGVGVTLQPCFVRVEELVEYKSAGDISPFDTEEAKPATVKTGTDNEEITW